MLSIVYHDPKFVVSHTKELVYHLHIPDNSTEFSSLDHQWGLRTSQKAEVMIQILPLFLTLKRFFNTQPKMSRSIVWKAAEISKSRISCVLFELSWRWISLNV